ncbi:MAG: DUF2149 domain-containing protein [Rhodoferax sp.]
MKLLHEPENDDPILSVVNIIDIFLVIIAALLITVAQNPLLNSFAQRDVTVITNPGQPDMEMVVKKGEKVERYRSSGQIGQGEGAKAGTAYRMKDGSMVYVPE